MRFAYTRLFVKRYACMLCVPVLHFYVIVRVVCMRVCVYNMHVRVDEGGMVE